MQMNRVYKANAINEREKMKAMCIDDKGNFKLCPYRVFQEEKKAMMIGSGDMVVQCYYPCAGTQCVAYHDGICLRAQEVLERMVQNGDK